jgi:hypothetical protein
LKKVVYAVIILLPLYATLIFHHIPQIDLYDLSFPFLLGVILNEVFVVVPVVVCIAILIIGKDWLSCVAGFICLAIASVYLLGIIFLPIIIKGTVIFPQIDYPIFVLILYLLLFVYSLITTFIVKGGQNQEK